MAKIRAKRACLLLKFVVLYGFLNNNKKSVLIILIFTDKKILLQPQNS